MDDCGRDGADRGGWGGAGLLLPPRGEAARVPPPHPTLSIRRLQVVHRVSSSLLGPVVPSFRALSGRLKFTVRRHKFNKYSLSYLRYPRDLPYLRVGTWGWG